MAELLAKAIDVHALDAAMPKDELGQFRQFLQFYGGLDAKGVAGRPAEPRLFRLARRGRRSGQAARRPAAQGYPARPRRRPFRLFFESIIDMQPTMLQPVGGMDRIAHAIYQQVKPSVRLNQPVTAIRREGDRVRIEHKGGVTRADYAVVTLPANLLSRIPSDFSPAKKAALQKAVYLRAPRSRSRRRASGRKKAFMAGSAGPTA